MSSLTSFFFANIFHEQLNNRLSILICNLFIWAATCLRISSLYGLYRSLMYSMYLLNVAFVKSLSSWNWYDLSSQYVILWIHWTYYLQDSIKNSYHKKTLFVKKTYLVRIQTKIKATRIAKPTVTIKPIWSFPDSLGRLILFLIVAITLPVLEVPGPNS